MISFSGGIGEASANQKFIAGDAVYKK